VVATPRTPAEAHAKRGRGRGRPAGAEQGVGREGLIAAARKLLEIQIPSKVTAALIAREAGADPALIRYHFGDRESLLLAVAEEILSEHRLQQPAPNATPAEQVAMRVRGALRLANQARSMQRLLIDELAAAKSPAIRARISALNAGAVARYIQMFDQNQAEPLVPADPLFMFIAVIGMCEFFASARPMIAPLTPADTDFDELSARYAEFAIRLVLDGLRPR
jgi:AcrR family transcriptional regulator